MGQSSLELDIKKVCGHVSWSFILVTSLVSVLGEVNRLGDACLCIFYCLD